MEYIGSAWAGPDGLLASYPWGGSSSNYVGWTPYTLFGCSYCGHTLRVRAHRSGTSGCPGCGRAVDYISTPNGSYRTTEEGAECHVQPAPRLG